MRYTNIYLDIIWSNFKMLFDNNMYVAAVNEYNEKADVWKNTISFIKDRPGVFKLKSWTHVLSIGTGNGEIEIELLRDMSKVKTFTAVEPVWYEELEARLTENLTNIQVDVVKAKAEEWSGPMEPVDLILLNCMFGYIEHPHRFLDRCMDWLRPGGTIFISVLDEEHVFNHFAHEVRFKNTSSTMHPTFGCWARQTRDILDNYGKEYEENGIECTVDIEGLSETVIPYFYWKPEPNQREVEDWRDFMTWYKSTKCVDGISRFILDTFLLKKV